MLGKVRISPTCLVLLSILSVVGVVLWNDIFTHDISFATLAGQRAGQRSGQRSNHGHAVPKFVAHRLYDPQTRKELDILNMSVLTFNPAFKNPCWWETTLEADKCVTIRKDPLGMMGLARRYLKKNNRVLRCLPYFQIVGQAKSGTTDLFSKVLRHPHALPTLLKETQWVSKVRTYRFCSRLNTYVNFFQKSANRMTREKRSKAIIGEATPSYLSVNTLWDQLPGNEGCSEPCVTNADIIHHLNPNTKIIIILRNPTDRLYSYYFHVKRLRKETAHKSEFHQLVIQELAEFQDCLKTSTPRRCAYNYTFASTFKKTDLRRGIYSIFVKDWTKVYPADQILILRFEDYKHKVEEHLQHIFSFLDLMPLSQKKLRSIATSAIKNRRKTSGRKIGDMWTSTRNILDRFYKPYNEQLASLLQNERFNW